MCVCVCDKAKECITHICNGSFSSKRLRMTLNNSFLIVSLIFGFFLELERIMYNFQLHTLTLLFHMLT